MTEMLRPEWMMLSRTGKESRMRELEAKLPEGFIFKRMERFERYGVSLETGVFIYKDSEFVWIPGDRVTLGWERSLWPGGMDQTTMEDMRETLAAAGMDAAAGPELLQQQMSPIRSTEIRAMLVERKTHSAGWIEVAEGDLDPQEDEDVLEQLAEFRLSDLNGYEVYQSYRLDRTADGIRICLFEYTEDLSEWLEHKLEEPFDLLTEEEWEYVYGGGTRSLFPWGDSFDYTMKVAHFGELDKLGKASEPDRFDEAGEFDRFGETGELDKLGEAKELDRVSEAGGSAGKGQPDRPFDLALPNGFGLCFLGDPYQMELTVSPEGQALSKGGDGGNGICGGGGIFWGYLPVATYFRNNGDDDLEWADRLDHLHYRRIIRL